MYLSLCLPTNGITEWVIPSLDSIYREDMDEDKFEVVVKCYNKVVTGVANEI